MHTGISQKIKNGGQKMEAIGKWSFIIGVILAVVAGVIYSAATPSWVMPVLAVLGLLVGLLNVTAKETEKFLVATIALLMTSQLGSALGAAVTAIMGNIVVFVAPAALIVALKAIWELAKEE